MIPFNGRYQFLRYSSANEPAMAALRALLQLDHILYGIDYPWGSPERKLRALDQLGLEPAELTGIHSANVLACWHALTLLEPGSSPALSTELKN
jgi:predicted TIM-barrel fold metal-dependent hydrolase